MEPIGFSTGSLAASDFRAALALLAGGSTTAVELSALRWSELAPLLEAIPALDLSGFRYVSVHAPSSFAERDEAAAAAALREVALRHGWPVVLHPDAVHRWERWDGFGPLLCIENMDRRKTAGRTADELRPVFERLPDASLCFDVAHARQLDPTMSEALAILRGFGGRLAQLHVSDLDVAGVHVRLTRTAVRACREIAELVPRHVPAIIESPVLPEQMDREVALALEALGRAPVPGA
ncbi:MAG TPA: hypothetical protein VFQ76_20285 [Longimicrobiaceae bacterium]|nr:hypothetical protein [Longimicrobiaceae bacterium]